MALHELNPTARFSDRARDYARSRPSYPSAAIDAIVRAARTPAEALTAVDIGAGTGISSRLLADRSIRVLAVEPNRAMREAGDPHPSITWIDGTAESTTLDPASVDLVLCAQAFHWFNPGAALAEFHRILRPRGVLCLLWNDRDDSDPLTAAYSHAVTRASDNHPAARDRSGSGRVMFHTPLFGEASSQFFPYAQQLTLDGLLGRALSASYTPKHGHKHDQLVAELTSAHERHADRQGVVTIRYRTRLYTATRV